MKTIYYHASQQKDINVLEPRISNHNKPLIYFSTKKENVLVYLSNAIEKYCKDMRYIIPEFTITIARDIIYIIRNC